MLPSIQKFIIIKPKIGKLIPENFIKLNKKYIYIIDDSNTLIEGHIFTTHPLSDMKYTIISNKLISEQSGFQYISNHKYRIPKNFIELQANLPECLNYHKNYATELLKFQDFLKTENIQ